MFKFLILQTLYASSDDATEFQIRDPLSFMRFLGLGFEDGVPEAKTVWVFREQLTRAGARRYRGPVCRLRRLAEGQQLVAGQSRRLFALAAIYDDGSRTDAARIGTVGLQTVRD